MSLLADKTERKAVTTLKKILPIMERLDHVVMSAADAFDTTTALNLIKRVIESNPEPKRKPKK
ncbi:hypothetical protein V1389_01710 [Flavobacterium rakeshii]|uniref:hypothetical protein n=1 Tax=Flavobacterium rakeshii TaxID=1038845 RepID=UPI002E7ABD62|nr:hypothetical protein [Flavobacterium rakeshii]MEE1897033.1 hypothetical protein [Flavobacterium rakeshii]